MPHKNAAHITIEGEKSICELFICHYIIDGLFIQNINILSPSNMYLIHRMYSENGQMDSISRWMCLFPRMVVVAALNTNESS